MSRKDRASAAREAFSPGAAALAALLAGLATAGLMAALIAAPVAAATSARALDQLDIRIGKAMFNRVWVIAQASTRSDDGIGPLFDARSCAACHPAGGRRAPVNVGASGEIEGRGPFLALGRPDGSGDPVYGRRLQIDAVPGLVPEGILAVKQTPAPQGLQRTPEPRSLAYGPLDPQTGFSLRAAPDLRGRSLMEQVPESAIAANAAAQPEAVRGRMRMVALPGGGTGLGRFGWKSSQPTVESQSAEAFFLDMGMSTRFHPEPWGDCTPAQTGCRNAPQGREAEGEVEIADAVLDRVVAYISSLDPPAPPSDPRGARLFAATGCATCHTPELPAGSAGTARLFSDLLLHDLGPGLADTLVEPGARASEWRTPPLAGISDALARQTGLLHDGRARSVAEAVAWHDGQGASAREAFERLSAVEREALIAYVSRL